MGWDPSEDGDVVVDLGPVLLGDALRDPDDVPALLLLQLQEGVEDAEVELLHERVHVQVHLEGQIGVKNKAIYVQGDYSGCVKPPVDIQTKVVTLYM